MNKRALKMQNEMLLKQVASLSAQIDGFKKRMQEYSLLLQARDYEINRLGEELKSAQSDQGLTQEPTPASPENPPHSTVEVLQKKPPQTPAEQPVENQRPTAPKASKTATANADGDNIEPQKFDASVLLDQRQKLAAQAIADITLKAAALDSFLQKSNDPNAGELQAMVLGKTELFKSQVFAVVKGGVDGAGFVASLETLKSQMVEYFENIKMQLSN